MSHPHVRLQEQAAEAALSSLFRIVDTRLSSSICGQFIYIYRLAVSYLTWHIKFVALPIKDGDFPQTVSFLGIQVTTWIQ
jgi:hypothetical protein